MVITMKDWRKPTWPAYAAEFVGTFCIVYVGGWVNIQKDFNAITNKNLANFNWTTVGVTMGILQIILIWGLQGVSGAHVNSAVTLALGALKKMPPREVYRYLLAQLFASIAANLLLLYTVPKSYGMSGFSAFGLPRLNTTNSDSVGFFCEFIGAGLVMYTFMAFSYDTRISKTLFGVAAGGMLMAVTIALGPTTGGGLNPSKFLGANIIQWFRTNDVTKIDNLNKATASLDYNFWFYYLGSILGSILFAFYYEFFMVTEEDQNPELSVASYERDDHYKKLKI